MEQSKEQKWYPVEYGGFWQIQNCEEYDGIDMLDADDVGEEQARENAILAASAPEWKKIADIMYKGYKSMITGNQWTEELVKEVDIAIKQYEQLIQEENGKDN